MLRYLILLCAFCIPFVSFADYQVTVNATAYNVQEYSGQTATGSYAVAYKTIAVDPSVIPLGSSVYVPGIGWTVANDTGGGINGYAIDIAMDSDASCYEWGNRTITVTVAE
jgi:3D (Asp-Asp-Asp) domain-containing protein